MIRSTLRPALWAVLLAACDAGKGPRSSAPPCPPCQCNCTAPATANNPTSPVATPAPAGSDDQAAALLTAANRKFAHKDGVGCLADLDRLTAIRPVYASSTATTRAFCEMLSGRCQQGKARLDRYWRDEQNMHPERAASSTETMAAMYCRGGDSNDRDRLLAALLDLNMGATETHTLAQCEASYQTVRSLQARVKPRNVDDHQVANLRDTLYASAPQCFARAGDCQRARAVFLENFPPERFAGLGPDIRDQSLQTTFVAIVARCK